MTAIGFVILVVLGLVVLLDIAESEQAKFLCGLGLIVGILATSAGVAIKLWQVMP